MTDIQELVGKTFNQVIKLKNKEEQDELHFISEGNSYKFYHKQDCCEGVKIEDICGYLRDLENTPIISVAETSNNERHEEICESRTWTFYIFRTMKGTVTIRWYGESNGYYSERVDFEEIKGANK